MCLNCSLAADDGWPRGSGILLVTALLAPGMGLGAGLGRFGFLNWPQLLGDAAAFCALDQGDLASGVACAFFADAGVASRFTACSELPYTFFELEV